MITAMKNQESSIMVSIVQEDCRSLNCAIPPYPTMRRVLDGSINMVGDHRDELEGMASDTTEMGQRGESTTQGGLRCRCAVGAKSGLFK